MKFLHVLCLFLIPAIAQAQLMDPALQQRLDAALPTLVNPTADDALHGRLPGKRLFYTGKEIVHSHQTENGDFLTSNRNVAANPDGLPSTGFEFPWKNPGGTDDSYVFVWKVMYLPEGRKVEVYRTRLDGFFANARSPLGWDWEFPVGTRFFEIMAFGDRLAVFEVRTRTKVEANRWRVNVFRPFPTRESFVGAVNGIGDPALTKWRVGDRAFHRSKTALDVSVWMDAIPGLPSKQDADRLLARTFQSAFGRGWTDDCAAPTTNADTSIVPKGYNGAIVGVTADSCMKCHQDAAQHVRFFDRNREWYMFTRGSKQEKILSFHPIDPSRLNGGTIMLNQRLVQAGIVDWRKP